MKYIMGLDIGISSVGWAVVNDEKHRIEDLGVRLFSAAEKPKDGGPINEERRIARGLRRRLKRRRVRMEKIKELFIKYGLITKDEKDKLYILNEKDIDTWQLRSEGLERKLNQREWARVLTSIAKRRGYQSNRKNEADLDKTGESKKILNAIKLNKLYMNEKGYRTIGEMFAKDEKYQEHKRNKHGDYSNCIDRSELEEEVVFLFNSQRKFENIYASEIFEKEYLEVFRYQKGFMSAELMEKMIGKCTLEKDEPRISKNTWSFERFMLLQKINNLSYEGIDGKKTFLTQEERKKVIDLAYEIKSGVKYSRIKKELNILPDAKFVGLNYFIKVKKNKDGSYEKLSDDEIIKKTEDSIFVKLSGYHEIKDALKSKCLEDDVDKILKNHDLLDEIAKELTLNKTSVAIEESLHQLELSQSEIEALENINFTKFGHLSKKAISKILPYLEEGLQYDKACQLAGYNYKDDNQNPKYKLPVISKDDIRNPVVYRAVTQTRKVINAIINKYGSPFEIHIEVGKELTKSFKERKEIENRQKENRELNEKLKTEIEEGFGIKAKPVDMLKVKLYREQQGKSAYSLLAIDYNRLFEDGYVQIDHAIPFSRSFDDSYNNKVLVLSKENQDKRNMTPYEYLGGTNQWEIFEAFVKDIYKFKPKKRENLLIKNMDEDKENEWIARNINDTKYMSRYLSNYIKKNLQFEDYGEKSNRVKVKTIAGAATTALRNYWGIHSKNREENDLHHAEDAVIIACASEKYQNKVREYSKERDLYYRRNRDGEYVDPETGEIVEVKYKSHDMARPWDKFKEELEARMSINPVHDLKYGGFTNYDDIDIEYIKPIFVSRMPDRKIKGQAHEETIYSSTFKKKCNNIVTVKKPLNKISKAEIEMVLNDEDCQELYHGDKKLYDAVYERLKEFDYRAEKAFSNEFTLKKQSKNGEGPVVNSLKVPSRMSSGVEVQGGIAANGSMVRIDVFEKNGKFYLVPIYVADLIKEKLPNNAIKAHKNEDEWVFMDESFTFKFSVYHNDLIKIKKAGEKDEKFYYYIKTNRNSGAITFIKHDKSKFENGDIEGSAGVQNLEIFEKYEVDILGNYHKVRKETRKGGRKNQ